MRRELRWVGVNTAEDKPSNVLWAYLCIQAEEAAERTCPVNKDFVGIQAYVSKCMELKMFGPRTDVLKQPRIKKVLVKRVKCKTMFLKAVSQKFKWSSSQNCTQPWFFIKFEVCEF